MTDASRQGTLLDRVFWVSLILKGLDGLLETVGGILLLVVTPSQINGLARAFTRQELIEDPHDFLDTHLLHLTGTLTTSASLLAALYLLLHGLVKIVLVWAVLRGHLRAYPWMIAFLILFIAIQGYGIATKPSVGLVLLTVFDMFIVWLTWREYTLHRKPSKP